MSELLYRMWAAIFPALEWVLLLVFVAGCVWMGVLVVRLIRLLLSRPL